MTEAEWNACDDPCLMFPALAWPCNQTARGNRKLRLFAVACCRLILHLVPENPYSHAVEMAEKYADRLTTYAEMDNAWSAVWDLVIHVNDQRLWTISNATDPDDQALVCESFLEGYRMSTPTGDFNEREEAALLRDIVGNPFRLISIDERWLTAPVTSLVQAIYTDRAFERLPILADALEDAGCHDADILAHCRGPGPHVRGCWVVDLLTGRA